jgi:hypothetical protein
LGKAAASCHTPKLAEGFFQGGLEALRQKGGGASGGDDHVVFAADAEFIGDVDAWLVGEGHAGFEDGFAAADEIGMLVDVEAHAVADAVGEEFVAGAKTCRGDLCAGGVIDGTREFSSARGVQGGVLRFADRFKGALHFFGGLAENAGAGNVGLIAFDEAAVIDQYDVTLLQCARLLAAMRQGGGWAKQNHGVPAELHPGIASHNEIADLLLSHSFLQICKNQAINVESSVAGETHEFEFVRGFAGAAGDGDGIGGDAFVGGSGCAEMIEKGEGKALFDADAAGAEIAVSESGGEKLERVFVFLPTADFGGIEERFAHAGLFECRADEDGLTAGGDDEGEEAFAHPPVDAREIVEAGAGTDEEGVEFGIGLGH